MSLSAKDVEEIMELLEASEFGRLSLEIGGMKIELERKGAKASAPGPAPAKATAEPAPPPPPAAKARKSTEEGLVEIKSPLLGTFYRAPKPGEPPFVEVGDRVGEDSVVAIIEVMKLMNSARAGIAGEVVEILAQNGEMVEHGEALMLVRPE